MKVQVTPDSTNRIVLTREMRRAAGLRDGQKLEVTVSPGVIVISPARASTGKVVKKGKLKVFTGNIPKTDIAEAVNAARHYTR